MALTDPSTLWTPNELQVLQQLFRMTLPHKNQSAQIYWEGFGVMGKYVYVCVCWFRCPPVCLLSGPAGDGCCRKTGIFPESLLMFWHIITVRHGPSIPFKDLFSTDPCSIDWTTGLEPMQNSSMSQSNTHCKCQGVLFSDWKMPLHLLTFLSSPSLVQDNRRINHVV